MNIPIAPRIEIGPTFFFTEDKEAKLFVKMEGIPEWVEVKRPNPIDFKGSWDEVLLKIYVTENGFVYYVDDNEPLQVYFSRKKYLYGFVGDVKRYHVHRLIANAFIPNPDPKTKDQVNHKDGVKTNNHYKNLEWVSCQENVQHAIATGLIQRKFTEEEIHTIRTKYRHTTQQQIADEYDISISLVNQILHGNAYGDISHSKPRINKTAAGENNPHAKFTLDQVQTIRSMYPKLSMDELGRRYGVDASCIGNMIKNKTYYDPTYVTPSTERIGSQHHHAKVNMNQVNQIRKLASTTTHEKLAEQFGLSRTAITRIVLNQAYIDPDYTPPEKKNQSGENSGKSKVTWEQVQEIREKFKTMTLKQIAIEYEISASTVASIVQNKTYYDPTYIPTKKI